MSTVSGRLMFDSERTAVASPVLPGIANVPIVLQNTGSGDMLAVLTDANGNYSFTNVPDGNYQIVEYYGIEPAAATPGDFATATTGAVLAGGVTPPIGYAPEPVPAGATNLDCLTPNTHLITVSGSDQTGKNILNGPVKYKPISTITDSHAVVSADNLLDNADYGTFGEWPPGRGVNGSIAANPYTGVGGGFTYINYSAPVDGKFAIMNINTNGAKTFHIWWRFADHTKGNETGRMMVINGYHPGAVIYEETVTVKPETYYLFSTWILNMIKVTGAADPALGVRILDSKGQVLAEQTLGQLIPANPNTPEWVEAGSVINSGANSELTVLFVSEGPQALGNDYAIDDIALYEVDMPVLVPAKTSSAASAAVGETVAYTVKLSNIYDRAITNVTFKDALPDGLTFVPGSVTVDGVSQPAADPNAGFALPDVPGGKEVTVTFSAKADHIPTVNPAPNTARITYDYTVVEGGIPSAHEAESNEVPLDIGESKIFGPRCRAIADVIESVAMQETALAHILNAEGEKIQAMLNIDGATEEQLLALNNSATRLIGAVTRLEMMLQAKLALLSGGDC